MSLILKRRKGEGKGGEEEEEEEKEEGANMLHRHPEARLPTPAYPNAINVTFESTWSSLRVCSALASPALGHLHRLLCASGSSLRTEALVTNCMSSQLRHSASYST